MGSRPRYYAQYHLQDFTSNLEIWAKSLSCLRAQVLKSRVTIGGALPSNLRHGCALLSFWLYDWPTLMTERQNNYYIALKQRSNENKGLFFASEIYVGGSVYHLARQIFKTWGVSCEDLSSNLDKWYWALVPVFNTFPKNFGLASLADLYHTHCCSFQLISNKFLGSFSSPTLLPWVILLTK